MCASLYSTLLLRFSQVMQEVLHCVNTSHILHFLFDELLHHLHIFFSVINDAAENTTVHISSPASVSFFSRSGVVECWDTAFLYTYWTTSNCWTNIGSTTSCGRKV